MEIEPTQMTIKDEWKKSKIERKRKKNQDAYQKYKEKRKLGPIPWKMYG